MRMLTRQGVLLMPMTPSVLPRGAQATASHPPDTSRFHKNFLLSTSTSIVPHIHRPSYPLSLLSIVALIHRPSYPYPHPSSLMSIVPLIHCPSYPSALLSITPIIHIHILVFAPLFDRPSLLSTRHHSYSQDFSYPQTILVIHKTPLISWSHPPSYLSKINTPPPTGVKPIFSVTRKFDLRSCSKHYDKWF